MSRTAQETPEPAPGPARPRPPRGRTRALWGISLGYFMVLLDMTVLSVAEPDLAAGLDVSTAGLQWATTGYTVAFAALLLSAGAAADRYGAERLFRAGVVVFALASLLCAAAPGLALLVVPRVVAGAAAAACVPASMAMIARLHPEPAARARAIAAWAAISGAAVAAGPLVGGALVAAAGWRSVFLVNVPLGLLVLALVRGPRVNCPRDDRRIDWPAQCAAVVTLALLTDALIAAGAGEGAHTAGAALGCVGGALVFRALERRSAAPVLNRTLLRSARVRAGLLAAAAVNFALTGTLFVLPLLLREARHLGPWETGLAFLPLTVPFAANPPLTGRIVARVGPRRPVLAGLALLAAGGAVLTAAVLADAPYGWLGAGLLLSGLGVSYALPALVTALVSAAPPGTTGAVSGLLNATRQTGATLGVAAMGAAYTTGASWSLALSACVCALAGTVFLLARDGAGR